MNPRTQTSNKKKWKKEKETRPGHPELWPKAPLSHSRETDCPYENLTSSLTCDDKNKRCQSRTEWARPHRNTGCDSGGPGEWGELFPLEMKELQRLRASGALHRMHRPEQPPVSSSGANTVISVHLCCETSSFIFAFCIFVCLICIHVCIYVCVCRYTCMHVCECMWRPEVVVWCLLQSLSLPYILK